MRPQFTFVLFSRLVAVLVTLMAFLTIADGRLLAQDLDEQLLRSLQSPLEKIVDEAVGDKPNEKKNKDASQTPTTEMPKGQTSSENAAADTNIEKAHEPLPGAILSLDEGLIKSQRTGKPLLVIATSKDCPWCYRLKQEMQKPPAQEEMERWTLVEIDVDADLAASKRLGVTALPSLRLLRPSGAKAADHDGYLSSEELVKWLKDNHDTAAATSDNLLASDHPLDMKGVVHLVGQLEDRDPLIREAAIRRLQGSPKLAAGPLVQAFGNGNLAKRLAILEIFRMWDAPLAGIDPWQPESIDAAALARLDTWSSKLSEADENTVKELSDEELAEANAQIDRLLTLSPAEGSPIAARLARHAEKLLPEVYRRLEAAETDQDRERLLALRYRLVADETLTLRFPGGVVRLASHDIQIRREAAEQLAGLASNSELPLLLELFSNPDPLIREIALRGLQKLGGDEATESLVRLLQDPEPNVRAAVLKQLAEQKTDTLVDDVAKYVQDEQDADLLVHAIRYLREVPSESSARALFPLLKHESWQVRAEAAEALQQMTTGSDQVKDQELRADIYAGLIDLLNDEDAYVVSRAIDAFSREISGVAVDRMFETAEKHPQLAAQAIEKITEANVEAPKVKAKLLTFSKSPDAAVRAAAIKGLRSVASENIDQWGPPALRDENAAVRIIAASAIFGQLESTRDSTANRLSNADKHFVKPPIASRNPPPSLLSQAFGALFGSKKPEEAAVVEEKSDEDTPSEGAPSENDAKQADPEATDAKPSGEEALPVNDRWDNWLAEFAAGKNRAPYYDNLIDPLEEMLDSSDPKEQLAAALPLVALGKSEQALPVIEAIVDKDPLQLTKAGHVLPWVPWKQRQKLFERFLQQATNKKQKGYLAMSLVDAVDRRATRLLWPLLKDETDADFASMISRALSSAYNGHHYWSDDEMPADAKAWILADAPERAKNGSELEALVGLLQYAQIDKAATAQLALEITNDEMRPETLKRDAYQVALVLSEGKEKAKIAESGIASNYADRQRLGIISLVSNGNYELRYIREEFYISTSSTTYYESSSDRGPIIPEPPAGISAEAVAPLLEHEDLMVRAYAGYVLTMFGKREGLAPLLKYWQEKQNDYPSDDLKKLVYRAIAKLNASEHVDVLRQIYETLDDYEKSEFYWTIRIMSGEEVLRLRKDIRDTYGIENLR
ncbi:hypothetical protein GC197_16315 [bacterium]|nr:hypothetical protein [bacterium]